MTTHLLIKAIALQVKAMAMIEDSNNDRACNDTPQWDYDDIMGVSKEIEALADQSRNEQMEHDACAIDIKQRIADASSAASNAFAMREQVRSDNLKSKSVTPDINSLELGFTFRGVNNGKDYHAVVTDSTMDLARPVPTRLIRVRVTMLDGAGSAYWPYSKTLDDETFKLEFVERL